MRPIHETPINFIGQKIQKDFGPSPVHAGMRREATAGFTPPGSSQSAGRRWAIAKKHALAFEIAGAELEARSAATLSPRCARVQAYLAPGCACYRVLSCAVQGGRDASGGLWPDTVRLVGHG
jgi:hypothetical protein